LYIQDILLYQLTKLFFAIAVKYVAPCKEMPTVNINIVAFRLFLKCNLNFVNCCVCTWLFCIFTLL